MKLGVNVPNFGPTATPDNLREWIRFADDAGFDLAMMSDHVAPTPDVTATYPPPFYDLVRARVHRAGVPFGARGRITDEYLAAITDAWVPGRRALDGDHVRYRDVSTGPRSARSPHPPLGVGGASYVVLDTNPDHPSDRRPPEEDWRTLRAIADRARAALRS